MAGEWRSIITIACERNEIMNFKVMKVHKSPGLLLFTCVMIVSTCVLARAQTFSYDFETDYQGWACDFSDYNVGDSVRMHLSYNRDTMPQIRPIRYGIVMKGDNYSDDLFFFMKKHITNLSPNVTYTIAFSIDVVTQMPPDGCGASDLILKAGATTIEPSKTVSSDMYRMNIDKGNQSQPGPDMDTLGHTMHAVPGSFSYRLVTKTNAGHLFQRAASPNGDLWLTVGAESAFEACAELLVAKIRATLTPLSTPIASKGEKTNTLNFVVHSKQGASSMAIFKGSWGLQNRDDPVILYAPNGKQLGSIPALGALKHVPSGIVITQTGR
jgi:hypothetical protein